MKKQELINAIQLLDEDSADFTLQVEKLVAPTFAHKEENIWDACNVDEEAHKLRGNHLKLGESFSTSVEIIENVFTKREMGVDLLRAMNLIDELQENPLVSLLSNMK